MNVIHLKGNLTRDIELRYTQGGMAIGKAAIATSRKFTTNGEKKEEVTFIDLVFFGRSAETANQYLNKGSTILITGRVTFAQWVDNGNNKRSKHEVVVENMEFINTRTTAPKNTQGMPQRDGVQDSRPETQPMLDDNGEEMPF